jgi:hypothetical protein
MGAADGTAFRKGWPRVKGQPEGVENQFFLRQPLEQKVLPKGGEPSEIHTLAGMRKEANSKA